MRSIPAWRMLARVERAEAAPALARAGERIGRRAGSSSGPGRRTDRAARRPSRRARVPRRAPRLRRRPAPRRLRDRDRSRCRAGCLARARGGRPVAGRRATGRRGRSRKLRRLRSIGLASIAVRSPSRKALGQSARSPPAPPAIAWKAAKRRKASPPALDERAIVGEQRIVGPRERGASESGPACRQRLALERPDPLILDRSASPRRRRSPASIAASAASSVSSRGSPASSSTSMWIGSRKRRSEG